MEFEKKKCQQGRRSCKTGSYWEEKNRKRGKVRPFDLRSALEVLERALEVLERAGLGFLKNCEKNLEYQGKYA